MSLRADRDLAARLAAAIRPDYRGLILLGAYGGLRIGEMGRALDRRGSQPPKEVAARAGHASVSFTLDRYGHLYPEADLTLRERLQAIYAAITTHRGRRGPAQPQVTPIDRGRPSTAHLGGTQATVDGLTTASEGD